MKIRLEKYGIRTRILILFTVLVIIPFFILMLTVFSVFQQYARKSYGDSMVDTLTAVTTQVKSTMDKYEESTMSNIVLHYGIILAIVNISNTSILKTNVIRFFRVDSITVAVHLGIEHRGIA